MKTETSTQQGVKGAVAKARAAQPAWYARSFKERAQLVKTIHYRLAEQSMDIAKAIEEDINKPLKQALMGDIIPSLDNISLMIKKGGGVLAEKSTGSGLKQFYLGARKARVVRQPYGVVAVIGTWNSPVFLALDPIISAILAGNTVVWKPSEFAPRTSRALKHIFEGLPENVVYVLEGDSETGEALTREAVDKIVFTGSTQTGRKVCAQAAGKVAEVDAELGGKDAMIVLEDADIRAAVKACVWGMTNFAGQTPAKPARLMVHTSVYDDFKDRLVKALNNVHMGHINKPQTDLGPMLNDPLTRFAEMLVKEAADQGATVLCGGERATEIQGNFFKPTVVENTTKKMRVEQIDIWAPIVTLRKFENLQQAISRTNEHDLGLTASIWSKNTKEAANIARQIDAGCVMINNVSVGVLDVGAPFSTRRMSGHSLRHGPFGMHAMTRPQVITTSKKGLFKAPYMSRGKISHKFILALIAYKSKQLKKLMHILKEK